MLEKDILFYQANFDPEVNRMLKALNENKKQDYLAFKNQTLEIVTSILKESKNQAEKEEWSVIYNLVDQSEFINEEEKQILSKFGIPFSEKFMSKFMV
jgi:hypothetical protein